MHPARCGCGCARESLKYIIVNVAMLFCIQTRDVTGMQNRATVCAIVRNEEGVSAGLQP
ncbi:hypothetical protein SAMCCGM7_Ch2311 [Sinorhizobium americanum CCGM7]|nr:hypothetical protein SAMCCGM7_Ch2311 [Sinorhizobium americanum CCGM7]